jgi:hypothetical protein
MRDQIYECFAYRVRLASFASPALLRIWAP